MEIAIAPEGTFASLKKAVDTVVSKGCYNIMVLHAEGGLDTKPGFKTRTDDFLWSHLQTGIRLFGGIFPGIFAKGRILPKGSIVAGFKAGAHMMTLENLDKKNIYSQIKKGLEPILNQPGDEKYNTLFVFGDGFGENNLALINALNTVMDKYPVNVIGGLAGRDSIKASHYCIFTPEKIIQNGAVLVFLRLESGIGVSHGWEPMMESALEITGTNGCFVEKINHVPALDFYLHMIRSVDPDIDQIDAQSLYNADFFFSEVAVKYPLGIIRKSGDEITYIDRTAVSVGGDKSLQFSCEIPEGTRACILHLKEKTNQDKCKCLQNAAWKAFRESMKNFPGNFDQSQVIMMDCFGRKKTVEYLGQAYGDVEFKQIRTQLKDKTYSPFGPLTFGEISSMNGGYVELHNKTTVVGIFEDK